MPTVGVLALQGDVREHESMLHRIGATTVRVRTPRDLLGLDGLVMPGGESTAIAHLLNSSGLREPLVDRFEQGFPVFGTCAGLILLSSSVLDGRADQWSFARLDVTVRRNGYGRQIASFETPVAVAGIGDVPGVFIRAPRMTAWGDVEILASYDHGDGAHPVLVRQGPVFGCSFHPELTEDVRVHELFVSSL
jgi:5'-phosphate synthase pdxT subunit